MLTRTKKLMLFAGVICLVGSVSSSGYSQTNLLRFPDIHEHTVAFCYGGDLWKAPANGGTAIRLTAHVG